MTSGSSMPRFSGRQSDTQLAAALGASLYVDGEYPFQALHPRHRRDGFVGYFVAWFAFRHDVLTLFAVGSEHAMEPGEVEPWARNQGRQAGNEIEGI